MRQASLQLTLITSENSADIIKFKHQLKLGHKMGEISGSEPKLLEQLLRVVESSLFYFTFPMGQEMRTV